MRQLYVPNWLSCDSKVVLPITEDRDIAFLGYDEDKGEMFTHEMFVNETNQVGKGNLGYFALGLAGEAGEVADQVKRIVRDDGDELTDERKRKILLELGDALWYLTALGSSLGYSLADIQKANVEKLTARRKANTIKGEGDNR